jgi:hypothetical protein
MLGEMAGKALNFLQQSMEMLGHRVMGRRLLSGIAIIARLLELSLQIVALVPPGQGLAQLFYK